MKTKKFVKIATAIIITYVFISIIVFIIFFYNHSISSNISEWGNFGDYFSGVLNPGLAVVNIMVFLYLTDSISKINAKNQLGNNACMEYLNRINSLTIDFFEIIGIYENYKKNDKYKIEAIEKLYRIKILVDSFVMEIEPLVSIIGKDEINKQENELLDRINTLSDLINSESRVEDEIKLFHEQKSNFVKTVYKYLI